MFIAPLTNKIYMMRGLWWIDKKFLEFHLIIIL
ncbi:not available [Bacillus cereus]|nr:not available [Bacillus cereus]AVR34915.1 not available [Bacillus cereus]QBZ28006.1 not available [Bacillus cereus]